MAECSVADCDKEAVARGWCPKHWSRWRNHGTPDCSSRYDMSYDERFWDRVDKSGSCWIWTGGKSGDGYGAIRVNGGNVGAHRFSYELHKGDIPDGMFVMHACDVPTCVNPDHLSLGTPRENAEDSARKGRRRRGSHNHQSKLTEGQVLDMRARYNAGGVSQLVLAREYGVSPALVSFILTRKAWKHI